MFIHTYKCMFTYFSRDREADREREREGERERNRE
jgi:hypothetical protein